MDNDRSITGEHKFTLLFRESDKTRNLVICAHFERSFRVHAAMNKGRDMVETITVTANPNHICVEAVMQSHSIANRQLGYSAYP